MSNRRRTTPKNAQADQELPELAADALPEWLQAAIAEAARQGIPLDDYLAANFGLAQ